MDSINWKKYLDEVTNLDVLEALETQIDKFRDAVQAAVAKLCKPFETMPSDTQLLYQKQPCGDAERKSRIVQTVPYILKILPRAHVSKTLKKNVRTILSLDTYFTTNLGWAGQWGAFRDGCRNTLLALGQPLERAYEEGNLRQLLGDFNPVPEADESDPNEGADKPGPYPPTTATAMPSSRLRQYIPPQCQASAFTTHVSLHNANLEAVYVHFLRLIAVAMNGAFQQRVKDVLTGSGVGGSVFSGGIKSYQRMVMKMQSPNDHGCLPLPRAAHNLDIVRCLVTFDTSQAMRDAFTIMSQVFAGGYLKFNNGHRWSVDKAKDRFYLRLVLSAGEFQYTARKTIGELRSDPCVQTLWRQYLSSGVVPPFVAPQRWEEQAREALHWLQTLPEESEISMICEIQMLLRSATALRKKMHEIYKAARAETESALDQDFSLYARSFEAEEAFKNAGKTEFHVACRDGLPKAVSRLLSVQQLGDVGTGLNIAATYGRRSCVLLLTDSGHTLTTAQLSSALRATAKGDGERDLGKIADMMRAAGLYEKNKSIVQQEDELRCSIATRLLDCGAVADSFDERHRSALWYACERGLEKLMKLLIDRGASVNARDDRRRSCLKVASTATAIRLLSEAKADLSCPNSRISALDHHASSNNIEPVQALLQAKAVVDQTRSNGMTALFMAAQKGHVASVSLLLNAKATIDLCKNDGASPLFMACQNGHAEVVRLLIAATATIDLCRNDGASPLFIACESGHGEVVRLLIAAKATIDLCMNDGSSPLYIACQDGHAEVVRLLIAAKADLDGRNDAGDSPLCMASYNGHAEVAGMMVDAGANYANTDIVGKSAVYWAQQRGHTAVVKVLVERIKQRETPQPQ